MMLPLVVNKWTAVETNIPRSRSRGAITPNNVLYVYGGLDEENQNVGDLIFIGLHTF
jgi:hypothetical protein